MAPPLQQGNRFVTETSEKADIHNQQFQSVFTTKEPLSISRLCTMKLQDMADSGTMRHEAVPAGVLNSTPVMEEFGISVNGILKLLQNLNPNKATGPDKLKPVLLMELREEIAPIVQIIFERSIQTGKLPADWCTAEVTPIFNKSFSYQDTPPMRSFLVCILNFDKTSKIFSKCNHLFGRHLGETHFVHKSRAITQLKNKERQNVI